MRCASFNVLADAYTGYGDYCHVDPELLVAGARTEGLIRVIDGLEADVVGLQEAEEPLVEALQKSDNWQTFWTPKGRGKADGCLTLVRSEIPVDAFDSYSYTDGSGHVAQTVRIGQVVFANTHIKWAPTDAEDHIGVGQTRELLDMLSPARLAVLFADCNDRPGGPVRELVDRAGFMNICGDIPTAVVNQEPVALDLLAVWGLTGSCATRQYDLAKLPDVDCPSDHIPVVADLSHNPDRANQT